MQGNKILLGKRKKDPGVQLFDSVVFIYQLIFILPESSNYFSGKTLVTQTSNCSCLAVTIYVGYFLVPRILGSR